PDLTGARPVASDTGPVSVANAAARGYGVIYTVAPSPLAAGMIWAGSDDGLVYRTTDGGRHWENVTPAGLPPWSMISLIEASPFDTAAAYAAVDRHRLDDFAPCFYRTRDGGQHWSRITEGIAPHAEHRHPAAARGAARREPAGRSPRRLRASGRPVRPRDARDLRRGRSPGAPLLERRPTAPARRAAADRRGVAAARRGPAAAR